MAVDGASFDWAHNWCSLYELCVSVSGLKLRLNIPDTAIIRDGRILGWFYTNKDGVVCRSSLHEISPMALFTKLAGQQTSDSVTNPMSYVALCHYESGISRPVKQHELQFLLAHLVGPYENPLDQHHDVDLPFCIQAYIIPMRDLRYIATYGGPDKGTCTVFARRFSARYTHATDDTLSYADLMAKAYHGAAGDEGEEGRALSAEEMLVESQLVAMGLLEPRQHMQGEGEYGPDLGDFPGGPPGWNHSDHAFPASHRAKIEATRLMQGLTSYVERAHGLRIQGLVAELVQAHPDVFVLLAVHAVQWDTRSSKGRLGTFTDRWNDFMAGVGPPPAPQVPGKRGQAPGLLQSADKQVLIMSERAGLAGGLGAGGYPVKSPAISPGHLPGSQVDRQYLSAARPGSAPAVVLHRYRQHPTAGFNHSNTGLLSSGYAGANNGGSSFRNAVASARRGAGGNPTAQPPSTDSYALWAPREALSTYTIAGSLSLEVEVLKERLQRQADIAARAELALTQLAVSSQATQSSLAEQLEEAKEEAGELAAGRKELEAEYERLRAERQGLKSELAAAREELRTARDALTQDRATLATTLRTAQTKEEGLEDVLGRLRAENEMLSAQVSTLTRRLEEEQEVTEAARSQLYDYKQMVTMLQGQLRRGKNKPAAGATGTSSGANPMAVSVASFQNLSPGQMSPGRSNFGGPRGDDGQDGESAEAGSQGGGTTTVYAAMPGGPRPSLNLPMRPMGPSPGGKARSSAPIRPPSASGIAQRRDFSLPKPLTDISLTDAAALSAAAAPTSQSSPSNTAPVPSTPTSPGREGQLSRELPAPVLTRADSQLEQHIRSTLAELRRIRKYGPSESGPVSIVAQQAAGKLDINSTGGGRSRRNTMSEGGSKGGAATAAGTAAGTTLPMTTSSELTTPREVRSAWRPSYESLAGQINDIFTVTGELSERMAETLGFTIALLRSYETELYEIFSYYAHLGKVSHYDDRLIMFEPQFCKLAKAAGFNSHVDHADDIFNQVAEKVMAYHFDLENMPHEVFIFFTEFLEALCRLAAAKYDWRPPETPDDDDDIEQPESLRHVALANITELPSANVYGIGPTAPLNPPASEKGRSKSPEGRSSSPEAGGRRGRPRSPAGAPNTDGTASSDTEPVVSALGPQPPDVVLYTMIKTFLVNDLLPNARRSNISGSVLSKQRAQERTVPLTKWL